MQWEITAFFVSWQESYWQQRHKKNWYNWMKNIFSTAFHNHRQQPNENTLNQEKPMKYIVIEAPTLTDEAAVNLQDFFYTITEAFTEHYHYQTERYHLDRKSTRLNSSHSQ